jgi:phosphoserine phosphatase
MTKHILVLTGKPGAGYFSDTAIAQLQAALPSLPSANALSDDAVEFSLPQGTDTITASMRDYAKNLPFDVNVVAAQGRHKQLLVADLESTIIEQECLDELAAYIGKQDEIVDITTRAMRGELDFEPALRARVAMLAGMPESDLQKLYDENVTLMPGAQTLLATMRAQGAMCGLVSGGFAFFASRIAQRIGFQRFRCNDLNLQNGVLDGTVIEPILGRAAKAEIMHEWCDELALDASQVLSVGDGSNDLAMLAAAGMGVAFRAKPAVAEAAKINIDYGDLTALLDLQGYHGEQFVSA